MGPCLETFWKLSSPSFFFFLQDLLHRDRASSQEKWRMYCIWLEGWAWVANGPNHAATQLVKHC